MKTFLTTAAIAIAVVFSAPAFAQFGGGGNIHGNESRGEPFNSSYRASGVDPATGYTPGHTGLTPGRTAGAHANAYVKKKKRHVTTTGSTNVRSGY
jgi:hypothetical protein